MLWRKTNNLRKKEGVENVVEKVRITILMTKKLSNDDEATKLEEKFYYTSRFNN